MHIFKLKAIFWVLVLLLLISNSDSSVFEVDEDEISSTNYGYFNRVFVSFFASFQNWTICA